MAGDLTVILGSEEYVFEANADSLAQNFGYFRGLLASNTEESMSSVVRLPHISEPCFLILYSVGSRCSRAAEALAAFTFEDLRCMAKAADYLQLDRPCRLSGLCDGIDRAFLDAKIKVFLELLSSPGMLPLAALCELQLICLERFINCSLSQRIGNSYVTIDTTMLNCFELSQARSVAKAMNSQAYTEVHDGREPGWNGPQTLNPDVMASLSWLSPLPFQGHDELLVRPVVVGGALSSLFHQKGFDDVDIFFVLTDPSKSAISSEWIYKYGYSCENCDDVLAQAFGTYHIWEYRIQHGGSDACMFCAVKAAVRLCVQQLIDALPENSHWVLVENRNSMSLLMDAEGIGHRHVQFVYWCYGSIDEMLITLDLPCTQLCFDGETLWTTPECIRSILTADIIIGGPFNKNTARRRYPYRLAKYALRRGFRLLQPKLYRPFPATNSSVGLNLLRQLLDRGGVVDPPKMMAGYGAISAPVSSGEVFAAMRFFPAGCLLRAKPCAPGLEEAPLEERVEFFSPWTQAWEADAYRGMSHRRRRIVNLLRLELANPVQLRHGRASFGVFTMDDLLSEFFKGWLNVSDSTWEVPAREDAECQTEDANAFRDYENSISSGDSSTFDPFNPWFTVSEITEDGDRPVCPRTRQPLVQNRQETSHPAAPWQIAFRGEENSSSTRGSFTFTPWWARRRRGLTIGSTDASTLERPQGPATYQQPQGPPEQAASQPLQERPSWHDPPPELLAQHLRASAQTPIEHPRDVTSSTEASSGLMPSGMASTHQGAHSEEAPSQHMESSSEPYQLEATSSTNNTFQQPCKQTGAVGNFEEIEVKAWDSIDATEYGQDYLSFNVGEVIVRRYHPEETDEWAYGFSKDTKKSGWVPAALFQ